MWTNQCVGYNTMKHFFLFVGYLALAILSLLGINAKHIYYMTYSPDASWIERLFLLYKMIDDKRGHIDWSLVFFGFVLMAFFLSLSYVTFAFQTAAFMAFNFKNNSSMTE